MKKSTKYAIAWGVGVFAFIWSMHWMSGEPFVRGDNLLNTWALSVLFATAAACMAKQFSDP